MQPVLSIAALSLILAATGASAQPESAAPANFTLPRAYDGYAQPEITDCTTTGALKRECVVPAMTAGRYLVVAVGKAASTGADATQALSITLNGAPCIATKPVAFTGDKSLELACEVHFLTDQPVTVAAVYAVESATAESGGPKLVFKRLPWTGIMEAHAVQLRPAEPAAGAPAAKNSRQEEIVLRAEERVPQKWIRFCDQNALELLNLEPDSTIRRFGLIASCSRARSAKVDPVLRSERARTFEFRARIQRSGDLA